MGRRLDGKEVMFYRAVIRIVHTPEPGFEEYGENVYYRFAGPYACEAQAKAAIARASRPRHWDPPGTYSATGIVQRTETSWEPDVTFD